jgi:hypothetical protein
MVASSPVNQSCSRSQATVAWASAASAVNGSNSPPDPAVPRELCSSTVNPCSANIPPYM